MEVSQNEYEKMIEQLNTMGIGIHKLGEGYSLKIYKSFKNIMEAEKAQRRLFGLGSIGKSGNYFYLQVATQDSVYLLGSQIPGGEDYQVVLGELDRAKDDEWYDALYQYIEAVKGEFPDAKEMKEAAYERYMALEGSHKGRGRRRAGPKTGAFVIKEGVEE